MKVLRVGAAAILALGLIVFGSNKFLDFMPLPEPRDHPGDQLLQAMHDGGLMTWIAISHIAVGVLLLVRRTRFLGALLQLPISLGIVAFHATMQPEGLAPGLVILGLNVCVLLDAKLGPALAAPA